MSSKREPNGGFDESFLKGWNMKPTYWIGGILVVIIALVAINSVSDEETLVATEASKIDVEPTEENIVLDEAPVSASTDIPGTNDVQRRTTEAATGPGNLDQDAEGTASQTEMATSDIGAASNAATDEAVEEIAQGDAPTSGDTVEVARDISVAEGVVGAEAAYQPDTFDPETVYRGIAESDLDTTVQNELAAELDDAIATEEQTDLETALAEIRDALGITGN